MDLSPYQFLFEEEGWVLVKPSAQTPEHPAFLSFYNVCTAAKLLDGPGIELSIEIAREMLARGVRVYTQQEIFEMPDPPLPWE